MVTDEPRGTEKFEQFYVVQRRYKPSPSEACPMSQEFTDDTQYTLEEKDKAVRRRDVLNRAFEHHEYRVIVRTEIVREVVVTD